jgi:hypothetical protein
MSQLTLRCKTHCPLTEQTTRFSTLSAHRANPTSIQSNPKQSKAIQSNPKQSKQKKHTPAEQAAHKSEKNEFVLAM